MARQSCLIITKKRILMSQSSRVIFEYRVKQMGLRKSDNLVSRGAGMVVAEHSQNNVVSIPKAPRPLSTEWISEELLLETRKLWSKAYDRVISVDEAVEILMNVKRVAEVLLKMHKEGHTV
jgi:hypothetical protein